MVKSSLGAYPTEMRTVVGHIDVLGTVGRLKHIAVPLVFVWADHYNKNKQNKLRPYFTD